MKGDSMLKYVLDGAGEPVEEPDALKWGNWFEDADRHVGCTPIGDVKVSTVFLGLDHAFTGGPPVLWETMVFGGPLDGEQDRYTSRADAEHGHTEMVKRVGAIAD